MRKGIIKGLVLICLLSLLGSCTVPPISEQEPPKIDMEIWHIWTTDTDANRMTFDAAVEELKKKYPNVNFIVQASENETYKIKIRTSVATGTAPDIFYTWGAGFSESFVESGKVVSLDEYYNQHLYMELPEDYLYYQRYNDQVYGLPFMQSYGILFVNKEMLEENDLPLPTTYENLLLISYELSRKGIRPMAVAGADLWPLMFHYATLSVREMGATEVNDALDGKTSFNQQGFIDAAYKLREMEEFGAFGSNYLYTSYDDAADDFKEGKAAMFYMGSWAVGGFGEGTEVSDTIEVMPYPSIGGPYDNQFLGGTIDCFMVSETSSEKELAMEITAELVRNMSEIGAQSGMGLPVWNPDEFLYVKGEEQSYEDYLFFKDINEKIIEITSDIDGVVLWWDTYLGLKGPAVNELIVRMVAGDIEPEAFVIAMDELIKED